MKLKLHTSIGEKYRPAMDIKTQEEADLYFKDLVDHNMAWQGLMPDRALAEKIERDNLGYFAGYFDAETRERVERLFKCVHPVFGSIAEKGQPSPEEAFQMGRLLALGKEVK